MAVSVANAALFFRWDGGWGCFLSETSPFRAVTESEIGVWVVVGVAVSSLAMMRLRVQDEEGMLKKRFGKEWEEWHAKTARFIPYLI
jgi:hypothetical protein